MPGRGGGRGTQGGKGSRYGRKQRILPRSQDEMAKLLTDLEANTTYHSFPRPKFTGSERRRMLMASKAERALKSVLQNYPALPTTHGFKDEDGSLRETSFKGPYQGTGGINPQTSLNVPTVPVRSPLTNGYLAPPQSQDSLICSTLRYPSSTCASPPLPRSLTPTLQCCPLPVQLAPDRPAPHHAPRRIYASPLDTLASTRLHIIEQEEDLRPYEIMYRRQVDRLVETTLAVALLVGVVVVGVGGLIVAVGGDLEVLLRRSDAWWGREGGEDGSVGWGGFPRY